MKSQRILMGLTGLNLALLAMVLAQGHSAQAGPDAAVLRGRALEIVDEKGKVRASIKLHPADPKFKMPNGKLGYPDTVVLRLITPDGRPGIKISASVDGSGILASGDSGNADWHGVQISSEESAVKLRSRDGRQQLIRP